MTTDDPRQEQLRQWLTTRLGGAAYTLAPASADASFRRYYRVTLASASAIAPDARTLIAMDAPPPQEDCRPFVRIAGLLRAAGVNAPRVFAEDVGHGFLLLGDLGTVTYLAALDDATAPELYGDAFAALVRFQACSRAGVLPEYDEALLRRELDLFPDWYVARHLARTLDGGQRATLERAFGAILANNLAQPRVFVHRDFHSRNLMVSDPNPGVLDFQDAVHGPVTYDAVSLLRDAYVEWDEARQLDWAARYWESARAAGVPIQSDFGFFWRDFEWMGVQRQLKVLGIFARLAHRDGKHGYMADMPRVMRYLRGACARYGELAPLLGLLDALDGREPVSGRPF